MKQRYLSAVLAAVMSFGSLGLIAEPAFAGRVSRKEKLWRLGTYIGGAGTIAALVTGNDTWALVGGGATLLSYTQWRKEARRRRKREDRAAYRSYRRAWLNRHRGRRIVRVR